MKKLIFFLLIMLMISPVTWAQGIGGEVIDFSATDIKGNQIKLSDFQDMVIILDFWATWCGPCRREIPYLIDIKQTFKDKKFEIISINGFERGSDEAAIDFVKNNKMDWVHVINKQAGQDIANKYKIRYLPTVYIIKHGKIVDIGLRGPELKNRIKSLLE